MVARDARFDGRFFVGVRTTGIYCRPICPTPPPKAENCAFYRSAAAAQADGFRPCFRCRPENAPGPISDEPNPSLHRAMSLIEAQVADESPLSVPQVAEHVGVSERTLRRLFDRHLGASPKQFLITQRTLFAKSLVLDSNLSLADVAFASGYGSVRRFNSAFRKMYGLAPSELRRTRRTDGAGPNSHIVLRLCYRQPFHWPALLDYLRDHAIPEIEQVTEKAWRRTFIMGSSFGSVEVRNEGGCGMLAAHVSISDVRQLAPIRGRLARMFDIQACADRIDAALAEDPFLRPDVRRRPGVRVPGAWDTWELLVEAILNPAAQRERAQSLASAIVRRWGRRIQETDEPCGWLFPGPQSLMNAPLESVGASRLQARTLRVLAARLMDEPGALSPQRPLEEVRAWLKGIPGIAPGVADQVAMRALGDPDAFVLPDRNMYPNLDRDPSRSSRWSPWRAYALTRLTTQARPKRAA